MTTDSQRKPAIIALALLVPVPTIGTLAGLWGLPGPVGQAIYFACKAWILALPIVWLLAIEKRRPSLSPPRRGGFGMGVGLGLAIGGLIVSAYFTLAAGRIDATNLRELATSRGFGKPAVFLAFAAYITLVNALLEEYVWRWFVFTRCERLMPGRWAVLAAAACFTLHHIFVLRSFAPWSLTIVGAVGVFVGGTAWSWCYLRFRSIWPGYVSHAIADAAILSLGWMLLFGPA